MNTNVETMTSNISTEVIDLIPAPETVVTPALKSHKPSLKTCVITGVAVGGVSGGIIAADRIAARNNVRTSVQLAIEEAERTLDLIIGINGMAEDDKIAIMSRIKEHADTILKGKNKVGPMSGLFFKKKQMKKDITARATILGAFYQIIMNYGNETRNDRLVTFIHDVEERFNAGIAEAIKNL